MDSDFSFSTWIRENTTGEEMAEKRINTISVELALQNEMAYRRKLQMLRHADSGDEIMPSQPRTQVAPKRRQLELLTYPDRLPSPTPFQHPTKPDASSSPRFAERKEAGSSSNVPPPLQELQAPGNLNNQSFEFYCGDCQVPCASSFNYEQHINGKKHKLKVEQMKLRGKDGAATCAIGNEKHWCKLCKIWCSDSNLLKMHLAGQKHKKMQAKLEGATTVEGEAVEDKNWCELCGIGCSSKELLQSHFAGKKHKAELRKLEYAQNGSKEAQNQPKRCKVCNIRCADKNTLHRHLMEKKHFMNDLEVKKRQLQDLIRAEGNNSKR